MLDFMWAEFHNVHDRTFGFDYRGQQIVELVNLRVRAVGRQSRPQIKASESRRNEALAFGQRHVFWRATGWIDVPLFRRSELALDQRILARPLSKNTARLSLCRLAGHCIPIVFAISFWQVDAERKRYATFSIASRARSDRA